MPHQRAVVQAVASTEFQPARELPAQRLEDGAFAGNGGAENVVWMEEQDAAGDDFRQVVDVLQRRHGRDPVVRLLDGHFADR